MMLSELPRSSLLLRRWLLEKIINENLDDPRLGEPLRQLGLINAALKTMQTPQDQAIGLDTLTLHGEVGGLNHG